MGNLAKRLTSLSEDFSFLQVLVALAGGLVVSPKLTRELTACCCVRVFVAIKAQRKAGSPASSSPVGKD